MKRNLKLKSGSSAKNRQCQRLASKSLLRSVWVSPHTAGMRAMLDTHTGGWGLLAHGWLVETHVPGVGS